MAALHAAGAAACPVRRQRCDCRWATSPGNMLPRRSPMKWATLSMLRFRRAFSVKLERHYIEKPWRTDLRSVRCALSGGISRLETYAQILTGTTA